jgi:hypothetical protein
MAGGLVRKRKERLCDEITVMMIHWAFSSSSWKPSVGALAVICSTSAASHNLFPSLSRLIRRVFCLCCCYSVSAFPPSPPLGFPFPPLVFCWKENEISSAIYVFGSTFLSLQIDPINLVWLGWPVIKLLGKRIHVFEILNHHFVT